MNTYKRCTMGLWDTSIPGITFDEKGISNYYRMFENYAINYPKGAKGIADWEKYVAEMKNDGKNKKYDCIIGVSGGTDSSYLLYIARKYGLRPLAVNADNGWSSPISIENIKKLTSQLNIDMESYVIDDREMKDLLISYFKSGLPWIDYPSDQAIKSVLFNAANKANIKYILIGHDFRSEGMQPNEWTYGDAKQLKYINKKYGTVRLNRFPNMSLSRNIYLMYFKKIKMIFPFYFLDYNKKEAGEFLTKNYGWEYYGGHHHENIFTKFLLTYWLPKKYGIDKRLITLSAQVCSSAITREQALEELSKPAFDEGSINNDLNNILEKLGMTKEEYQNCFNLPPKTFLDYPSYHPFIQNVYKMFKPMLKVLFPQMPAYFVQIEERNKK